MKQQVLITFIFCILSGQIHAGNRTNESILGTTDFTALMGAIPEMPTTTQAAYSFAYDSQLNANSNLIMTERFADFNAKKELYSQRFESHYQSRFNDFYDQKGGDEGIYRDIKKQVNSNEIIQSMGGVDQIQQMSESQRKSAAKNAAAKQAASSSYGLISEEDMQRMMSDPAYAQEMAAKFNNMTDKQKAELVQNHVDANPIVFNNEQEAEANHQAYENSLKKSQQTKNAMLINSFVSEMSQRLSSAVENYRTRMDKLRKESGNHEELNAKYDAEYSKIPLVVMGEGKTPDPYKVKALNEKYADLHRKRANQELAEAQSLYKQLLSTIRQAQGDYYSFLDQNGYRVEGRMSGLLDGSNTEMSLAQTEMGIGGAISEAADICYFETSTAAGYEHDYWYSLTE